jgi:hypothetical protein
MDKEDFSQSPILTDNITRMTYEKEHRDGSRNQKLLAADPIDKEYTKD